MRSDVCLFHVQIIMPGGGASKRYVEIKFINLYLSANSCQQLTAYIAAVLNEALTASSVAVSEDGGSIGPENSRLFTTTSLPNIGGWMVAFDAATTVQYIQVSQQKHTKIVMVCVTAN